MENLREVTEMRNQYKNMLNYFDCSKCGCKNVCFLRRVPLSKYPEHVQEFLIKLPQNIFLYQEREKRWYANYWSVQRKHCRLIMMKTVFVYMPTGYLKCIYRGLLLTIATGEKY